MQTFDVFVAFSLNKLTEETVELLAIAPVKFQS